MLASGRSIQSSMSARAKSMRLARAAAAGWDEAADTDEDASVDAEAAEAVQDEEKKDRVDRILEHAERVAAEAKAAAAVPVAAQK